MIGLIILLLLPGVTGSLCGDPRVCYCNTEMGLLACLNVPLEKLPVFTDFEKATTVHLDIAETRLTTLPDFPISEWPLLRIVDLRDNPELDICEEGESRFPQKGLTLLTDCPRTSSYASQTNGRGEECHLSIRGGLTLVILVLTLIIVVICLIEVCRRPRVYAGKVVAQEDLVIPIGPGKEVVLRVGLLQLSKTTKPPRVNGYRFLDPLSENGGRAGEIFGYRYTRSYSV